MQAEWRAEKAAEDSKEGDTAKERCGRCKYPILQDEEVSVCRGCGTWVHDDCQVWGSVCPSCNDLLDKRMFVPTVRPPAPSTDIRVSEVAEGPEVSTTSWWLPAGYAVTIPFLPLAHSHLFACCTVGAARESHLGDAKRRPGLPCGTGRQLGQWLCS